MALSEANIASRFFTLQCLEKRFEPRALRGERIRSYDDGQDLATIQAQRSNC